MLSHAPKYWLQFTLVFMGYLMAGRLGQATTNIRSSNLGPVWPAYGVALASILLCGYRIWPAVASAAFVIAFLSPEPYLTALGQAAGSTLAAVTGVFLLRRLAGFDNSISRLRDAVALVLLGGLGSAMVSATLGTLVLHASDVHAYSGLAAAWLIYWLGDSTGVLLVTPLILTIPNLFRIRGWGRLAELGCLLVMLVGACMVVFDDLPIVPVRMLAFAILPLIIWAAVRFGVGGAALSIFTVASVATVETALGSGSFASSTPFVDGVQLDAFFMVLSLTGLTLATLYSERERAERERAQSLRQQVAMETRLQNEERLRNSEARLREYERAVEGVEEIIVVVDREYRCVMANQEFLKRRNLTSEEVIGHFVYEFVDQEVYEDLVKPKLDECFQGRVVRFELTTMYPQLGERDLLAAYYPVEGSNGVDRAACILHDITDRKQAEQVLAGMSRKLIAAQEQERARIGRELHDDINQRLAMMAVELQVVQNDPSALQNRLQQLRNEMAEISNDVQALSHELHSSKLEYLGVVAGMKSWCNEFAQRQKMEIACKHDVRSALSNEIGLCLFRVLQEALHNAVKHSGVKRIDVQLYEDPGEIHLVVRDSGRGFDVAAVKRGKGLGLTSMRERVRLVNGTIAIESKPMGGTTIHVRVPLESEHVAKRQAV